MKYLLENTNISLVENPSCPDVSDVKNRDGYAYGWDDFYCAIESVGNRPIREHYRFMVRKKALRSVFRGWLRGSLHATEDGLSKFLAGDTETEQRVYWDFIRDTNMLPNTSIYHRPSLEWLVEMMRFAAEDLLEDLRNDRVSREMHEELSEKYKDVTYGSDSQDPLSLD